MKSRDVDILIVPGLGGSGPNHWQSRWQAKLGTARRVEQADWARPDRAAWTAQIAEAIAVSTRPVVMVAHSLGVIASASVLATCDPARVIGAYLVAPPDRDHITALPEVDSAFRLIPDHRLACPSVVVASADDPYATLEATRTMAEAWGSTLIEAGMAGHINVDSGHGPWPEGLMAFAGFLSKLPDPV